MSDGPRYLSLEETAVFLNLPLSAVYSLSAKGRLPGKIKYGQRTIRVDREKLVSWLETQADGNGGHREGAGREELA